MPKRSTTENPAEKEGPVGDVVVDSAAERDAQETSEQGGVAKADRMPAGVMYVGTAHVREIDAAAWRSVDVSDQNKVVWDNRRRGKNVVPLSELSQAAIDYLVNFDDGFVLVDENGKRV